MNQSVMSEKIINSCKKVEPFLFYGFIFFVPISIAISEVFASFTLFFFFVKRWTIFITSSRNILKEKSLTVSRGAKELLLSFFRIVKPEKSILSRPLGLFIFICGVSVLFSQYPVLSLQGFFFKVLQWTYLYFVFIEFMKEKKHLAVFIGVLCVSAGIVFANGIFQYFNGKDFIFGETYSDRLFSSFRHPNDFGGYLVLICPAILALMLFPVFWDVKTIYGKLLQKVFFIVLFLSGYFCLGMTFSRGAWLGFLAAMFLGSVVFFYRHKKTAFIPVAVAILFLFMFLGPLQEARKMSLISHAKDGSAEIVKRVLNKDFSAARQKVIEDSDRVIYWNPAIRNIRQSPFIGTGVNTYSKVASLNPPGTGGYPHNCYLQMTAEIGLLGLGAFLWVLFVLFVNSFKVIRKVRDPFLDAVMIGFLCGLFGFLVHSFFDTNFYSVQLGNLMWVVMGVIVVAQKIALKSTFSPKV